MSFAHFLINCHLFLIPGIWLIGLLSWIRKTNRKTLFPNPEKTAEIRALCNESLCLQGLEPTAEEAVSAEEKHIHYAAFDFL